MSGLYINEKVVNDIKAKNDTEDTIAGIALAVATKTVTLRSLSNELELNVDSDSQDLLGMAHGHSKIFRMDGNLSDLYLIIAEQNQVIEELKSRVSVLEGGE